MRKTVYRILSDSGKTCPTIAPYFYTTEDFIDEYMNRVYINYKEVGAFDNIDDALYTFNNTQCAPARLVKMSNGYYFYLYEVLILQAIFYDDDENIEKTEWLSKKASFINE